MGKRPKDLSEAARAARVAAAREERVKRRALRSNKTFSPSFEALKQNVLTEIERSLKDDSAEKTYARLKKMASKKGIIFSKSLADEQEKRLQNEKDELIKKLSSSPLIKGLQQKFITTIFPVGGSIVMSAYNVYNAKPPIMTESQRNELNAIGNKITNIPTKMLSGEWDLQEAYQAFTSALDDLTHFVTNKNNFNIVINIGGVLLESLHPLGSFIRSAIHDVTKSDLPQNLQEVALRGLGSMATHYDKLEKGLKTTAEKGITLAQNNQLDEMIIQKHPHTRPR